MVIKKRSTFHPFLCKVYEMASSKLKLEKLPPTERAAYLHCLRVYLGIQEWTTLEDNDQEVVNLGWTLDGNVLVLQMTSYWM